MQLKAKTIKALVGIINGETKNTSASIATSTNVGDDSGGYKSFMPYKTGPDLVRFFNELGSNDLYDNGFGSRGAYTESKLRELKNIQEFSKLINELFHPQRNLEDQRDYQVAADYLNNYLKFDNIEIYSLAGRYGTEYHAKSLYELHVVFPYAETHHPLTHEFIQQQVEKCHRKINEADYSGAITNARGQLEEVLKAIQLKLDPEPMDTRGSLPKLYKEVQKLLNLDPNQYDVEAFQDIMRGLSFVVSGLAPLRNSSSDSHAAKFKPLKHHAQLAVNAANTLCTFLFETFEHQQAQGRIETLEATECKGALV